MTLRLTRFNWPKKTLFGLIIITVMTAASLLAPWIARIDPFQINSDQILISPDWQHWMGTDQLGRDVFSRLLYGGRVSLIIAICVVILSTALGIIIGAVAGYYGGLIDACLMRLTDVFLCFPVYFLILSVVAMLEPSLMNIVIILAATGWMGQARLIRAEILSIKEREYVLAARAYGASAGRIIVKHLIPNAMGPVIVSAILGVAGAIMTEAALSFLGLGVQPPIPSWGNLLSDAKSTLGVAWWLTVFPGLAIFLTILGYHLIGEGQSDRFRG